jgi:hypothetical protein
MTDTFTTPASADDNSAILSWRAIIAGAVAAAALTLILLAFGSAVGFSAVSPWSNSGVSATTFSIATGIYLIVVAMLASTIGGYLAGRLRPKWSNVARFDVQFRDTAHGFLAWALATVIGAAMLGGAATYLVGGATTGAAAGGSAAATQASSAPSDYFVDMLLRPGPNSSSAAQGSANPNREVGTIFARSIGKSLDFSPADRTYLAQVVATRTGLSQADAEKRVNDVITQAKAAADKARKAAAALSIWLAISMLVGAFSASLAALEGGQLRDGKWKGVFGTRGYREAHNQP